MKEQLKRQYELRFSSFQYHRNKVWRILINSFFNKFIPHDSIILDLGCGWGEFINNVEGKKKIGMDLNREVEKHLIQSVDFLHQDCSQKWPLDDSYLDVVFSSNFFEHFPDKDKINRTIIQVKRCLKQNGILICLGPNIRYLSGRYWDFWDHQIGLTEKSFSELLTIHDFRIDTCESKFLPYTMSDKKPLPSIFVKLYLYFPILWKFLGKQFLIIALNNK